MFNGRVPHKLTGTQADGLPCKQRHNNGLWQTKLRLTQFMMTSNSRSVQRDVLGRKDGGFGQPH